MMLRFMNPNDKPNVDGSLDSTKGGGGGGCKIRTMERDEVLGTGRVPCEDDVLSDEKVIRQNMSKHRGVRK